MKFLKEIQVITTDFRRDVIQGILSAFPGRAMDDEDPSNDTFLIDGVPVKVEADRIVVGKDFNNYIPLKNPPIAGNPPQYREIDSIIADFKAYVNKERNEEPMNEMIIQKPVRIPGTNIILEKDDRIYCKRASMKEATISDIEKLLQKTGWTIEEKDEDYLLAVYEDEVFSLVVDADEVNVGTDEGSQTVWTGTMDDFVSSYKGVKGKDILVGGKILKAIVTESLLREATEVFKKTMLKKPGDTWKSKDGNWGVWWDADDRNVLWIYEADSYGEDFYETESLEYDDVISIVFKGDDYKVNYKESSRKKEMFTGKVAALMRALEREGWNVDSSYEYDATFQMGNIFVTVHDDGRVFVRDRYDAKGFLIQTNVTSFARDYGKIIDKYLKPRYDYGNYRIKNPMTLDLI